MVSYRGKLVSGRVVLRTIEWSRHLVERERGGHELGVNENSKTRNLPMESASAYLHGV